MMIRPILIVAPVVLAALLSACGASRYCVVEQEYQTAASVPELRPAGGLLLPESPSALRLPPAPANPEPFGVESADGFGICLDKPPGLQANTKPANS